MLKMFVYARLMSTDGFAQVSLILSTYTFLFYVSSLGVVDGLLKLGSISSRSSWLRYYSGSVLVWGSWIVFVASVVVSFLLYLFIDEMNIEKIPIVAGLCLSAFFFNVLETTCRALQRFHSFSLMLLCKTLIATGLGCFNAFFQNPNLVLWSEIFAFLIVALYFHIKFEKPCFKTSKSSWIRFVKLVRHGLPLLLTNLAKKLCFVIDRWVVVSLLGISLLAQYSFIMLIYLGAMSVIGILNAQIGPRVLSGYGSDGDLRKVRRKLYYAMSVIVILMVPVGMLFEEVYPFCVDRLFPVYSSQIVYSSAKYIAFGMLVYFMNCLVDWLLIVSGESYRMFFVNIITLFVAVSAYVYFYFSGGSGLLSFATLFLVLRIISLFLSMFVFEVKYKQYNLSIIDFRV
ncbi:hypothetical protein [Desulfuromonas acetoxidans]|uniref:lipopolysaccharide biosynthesis protein n=1 Tax=Desulfuromonas acetoxidans TaxID=891 RepID=UPI00292D81E4|nr:hypothetical protein [Desulfuromonas acetoxidans]